MSILDKTSQEPSITEGSRALRLFLDRHDLTRLLAHALNVDPSPERILFFHGDGGSGKSLLLRYLRSTACKKVDPDDWPHLERLTDEDFRWRFEQTERAIPVPSALLDFGMQPQGSDRPMEAFSGLLMLRRTLAEARIRFPVFDFACVVYLLRTNQLTDQRLRDLFPLEELDFLTQLASVLSGNIWVGAAKAVITVFDKHLHERFQIYRQRRRLDIALVEAIEGMDPQTELVDELPNLFAKDLNAAMTLPEAPARLALFFDTHEAFWGHQRALPDDVFFQRDEWLRRLMGSLELTAGIVAIVAGREAPRWDAAPRARIPSAFVSVHLVGNLAFADARTYLTRTGIEDVNLQASLLRYAATNGTGVHPLFLGLCADLILAAMRRGVILTASEFEEQLEHSEKPRILLSRLCRYVDMEIDDGIRVLSACRAFDFEIYRLLGDALHFHATRAQFEVLTSFSFVWPVESRTRSSYRIHDLMRRVLREQKDGRVKQAHEFLEAHFRLASTTGDTVAHVEAIYHANQLDVERGIGEWINLFDQSLERSLYDVCGALLDVRGFLTIDTGLQRARIALCAGAYLTQIARYDDAEQEYSFASGNLDCTLNRRPETPDSLICQGKLLAAQAALKMLRGEYGAARYAYARARDTFGHASLVMVDAEQALILKSETSTALGFLESQLSQYAAAEASYADAQELQQATLLENPEYSAGLRSQGETLAALAGLRQMRGRDLEEAIRDYERAVISFDRALLQSSGHLETLIRKGDALGSLAALFIDMGRDKDAESTYLQASDVYEEALLQAPDSISVHTSRGLVLMGLGESQRRSGRLQETMGSHFRALQAFDQSLQRAPGHVLALSSKGQTLARLAETRVASSNEDAAIQLYSAAIQLFDAALRHAHHHVLMLTVKGITLTKRAFLEDRMSRRKDAIVTCTEALEILERVLEQTPDDRTVRAARDEAVSLHERLKPRSGQPTDA